ncbi:cupredoxin domain-containing protein [Glaciimonas immobilis]|uniref:Putative cupredoxin-like copper-binding protein n=1 Tax=Glaciimonas immobilis TaxID=728004 RepID=A0A840S1E5_9BURK|nr:cupredoxin family protein [Glaciimonas immobilis]KAF3995973.1 cupredoxin family protein [Glaciimonas immobilis]MBB5202440.1 putative cupredoxin-like copper-binding protein [Glaciimonas immobilis]
MKSVLIASALALSLLSLNAFAHGDEGHAASGEKEGHAATMGLPGDANKVSKTMEVDMSDAMRFTPSTISVKRGETVKFVVKNTGTMKHEMVLGSINELKEHAALMIKFPEMEHSDPNQIAVEPGKAGELVWKFSKAGTFDFACLQPGHFEAGMRGKIVVQ